MTPVTARAIPDPEREENMHIDDYTSHARVATRALRCGLVAAMASLIIAGVACGGPSGEYVWHRGEPYPQAHPRGPSSPLGDGCWFADDGLPVYSSCDVWHRACHWADHTWAINLDQTDPRKTRRIDGHELDSLCTQAWLVCMERAERGIRPRWPATLPWHDGSDDVEDPNEGWVAVVPSVNRQDNVCDP